MCFSDETFKLIKEIKDFNYKNIYKTTKICSSTRYFNILLHEIYYILKSAYNGPRTLESIEKMKKVHPEIFSSFEQWLTDYWQYARKETNYNDILFDIENKKDYCKAIIYYISGMTDNFAIDTYNKIIGF